MLVDWILIYLSVGIIIATMNHIAVANTYDTKLFISWILFWPLVIFAWWLS